MPREVRVEVRRAAADDGDGLEDAVPPAQALVERGHHRLVRRHGHRRAVPPDRHPALVSSRPSLPDRRA